MILDMLTNIKIGTIYIRNKNETFEYIETVIIYDYLIITGTKFKNMSENDFSNIEKSNNSYFIIEDFEMTNNTEKYYIKIDNEEKLNNLLAKLTVYPKLHIHSEFISFLENILKHDNQNTLKFELQPKDDILVPENQLFLKVNFEKKRTLQTVLITKQKH